MRLWWNVYYDFKNFKCQCINYVVLYNIILLCIVYDDFVVYEINEINGFIILSFFHSMERIDIGDVFNSLRNGEEIFTVSFGGLLISVSCNEIINEIYGNISFAHMFHIANIINYVVRYSISWWNRVMALKYIRFNFFEQISVFFFNISG